MASQFFGLNIAYTGLLSSNAALNTTSNNIANEQTEGYSRQQVSQVAADPLRTYTTYGCSGSGVDVKGVERVRDAFYDFKYWGNQSNVGEYETLQYYMAQIEDLFRDDTTTEGFSTVFDKMYANLDELMKSGGTATTREQFLGSAQSLTYYFNSVAESLEKMQLEINTQIQNKIDTINSYASELATLNKQINVVEMSGQTANELRDQRDLIIDKLSLIVNLEIDELPITDANNQDRETGGHRYIVKIAGGQTLVDSEIAYQLECVSRQNYERVNQSDALGLYDIYFTDGREFNVYGNNLSGELRGLIEMRDGNNGENFTGTVESLDQTTIDGETYNTVTVSLGCDLFKDFNCCTLPEAGGIIQLGSEEYYFDSFIANFDANGQVESYTFVISKDLSKNYRQPTENRVGKSAQVGPNVEYQGIPYYQEQLTEWARSFAQAFNKEITQENAVDNYGNPADIFFKADMARDISQYHFDASDVDYSTGTVSISSEDDSYYKLTAKNFAVSDYIVSDVNLMATHTNQAADSSDGVDKYDVIEDLISIKTDKTKMKFRGRTSGEFLQCVLADVALNTQNANTFYENYTTLQGSIENQRLSISGVDSDEEAINLVKYQHSYNLASQMVQVLTEIYDRLILQTGV